ncbi:hypothetical protein Tco_0311948 [Tanacetum coccineum]
MDIFTKGALWDYWKMGSDEIEPTDDESSNFEETNHDDEQEIGENFRIETNMFDYETPLCKKFKEFNYLLKIDPDILTKDIEGFKLMKNTRMTGFMNGIKTYLGELKEQALRNKAIMEGLISDNESCNDGWKRWESHEITYHDHDEINYENETHDEKQELCELPVCNMRRFKMIKYSFEQDEEYVAIKEDEYDDLARTSEDACRAYQEIFRMMDEGWMVARAG